MVTQWLACSRPGPCYLILAWPPCLLAQPFFVPPASLCMPHPPTTPSCAHAGCEEGNVPLVRVREELTEEQMAEERRLFFVALTRARHHLHLLYARQTSTFGADW